MALLIYFIGIDAHFRSSSICILNEAGERVKQLKVRGDWTEVARVLKRLKVDLGGDFKIGFEATTGYGALYDTLQCISSDVSVAHPRQLELIYKSKKKSDRIDAYKLARLLRLNDFPKIHVPDSDVRSWRRQIESRRKLVNKRTRCKNMMKNLLRRHGIKYPKNLWTKKNLVWYESVALPSDEDCFEREQILAEYHLLDGQVKQLTGRLNERAQSDSRVQLLLSIPGVGPRTAECFVAYVDKPDRFKKAKQIGAYFGVVPELDQSSSKYRLGHITCEGPSAVRQMITESCWQAKRLSPTVKSYFDRVSHGRKTRHKTAVVATGHYLLRCMWSMLRSGEVWRERVVD